MMQVSPFVREITALNLCINIWTSIHRHELAFISTILVKKLMCLSPSWKKRSPFLLRCFPEIIQGFIAVVSASVQNPLSVDGGFLIHSASRRQKAKGKRQKARPLRERPLLYARTSFNALVPAQRSSRSTQAWPQDRTASPHCLNFSLLPMSNTVSA